MRSLASAIDVSADLLLHAGAVERDGRAVLFPGASGVGKSTLTAACLTRGFGYLSDEAVAVALDTGHVTGLPRPLMLTSWSIAALGLPPEAADAPLRDDEAGASVPKRAVTAEIIGAATVTVPVPVRHVVLVRHGAGSTRIEPVAAGEVLTEVLAASFNHYRLGERAWEAAARMSKNVAGWRLEMAGPGSAADAVAELLEER